MKKVLLFLLAIFAISAISCSKDDDDNSSSSGTATVTLNGNKYACSSVVWHCQSDGSCTIEGAQEDSKDGGDYTFLINLSNKSVGTYPINASNSIGFDVINSARYKCTSGTIEITSSDSKTVKGTFTGKFVKEGTTKPTVDITGTFTAVLYIDDDK